MDSGRLAGPETDGPKREQNSVSKWTKTCPRNGALLVPPKVLKPDEDESLLGEGQGGRVTERVP